MNPDGPQSSPASSGLPDSTSPLFQRCREILEGRLETGIRIPHATGRKEGRFLTIGMATHADYDGCYSSIQPFRLFHPEILSDVEFLVLDNDPAGSCAKGLSVAGIRPPQTIGTYSIVPYEAPGARSDLPRGRCDFVLCLDSRVRFPSGARDIDGAAFQIRDAISRRVRQPPGSLAGAQSAVWRSISFTRMI